MSEGFGAIAFFFFRFFGGFCWFFGGCLLFFCFFLEFLCFGFVYILFLCFVDFCLYFGCSVLV